MVEGKTGQGRQNGSGLNIKQNGGRNARNDPSELRGGQAARRYLFRCATFSNHPAAHDAPAKPSRRLLPPSTSFRSGGVQPHRRRRLCSEGSEHGPLVSTSFRVRRRVPGGDPAPPLGSRDHLNRRRRRVGVALRLRELTEGVKLGCLLLR